MRTILPLSALLAALTLGVPAVAQMPAPPPAAPPPAHHGLLGGLLHRPARPGTPSARTAPITGGIVGNKKSHVYHLPGDKGALPGAQNRVYFATEAQAVAAGYHKAGGVAVKTRPTMGGKTHAPATAPAH